MTAQLIYVAYAAMFVNFYFAKRAKDRDLASVL